MSIGVHVLFIPRTVRLGWVVMLSWGLMGCTTASGRWNFSFQDVGPLWSRGAHGAESPRALLAMNDPPGGASSEQPLKGYNIPGRNPDSQMPWEFFLGNASHQVIAFMYGVNHPKSIVYYNIKPLDAIIDDTGLGDVALLLPDERKLRPDITDALLRVLFEIKPGGSKDSRRAVRRPSGI